MVEPVDLTQARRVHRQRLRDESTHVTKVLPDTDGELSRALCELEEVRLLLAGEELDEVGASPSSMQPLADAVGRLASYVAAWERQEAKVQPLAPGGAFELVPLLFVSIGRMDLNRIEMAVAGLDGPSERWAVDDFAGGLDAGVRLVEAAKRLVALLRLPWDDDVDTLHARLAGASGAPGGRVELTVEEHAAYVRVTERILATWHGNSPLERYMYRG